jgi:lipopolysaccharide export system protein LptC
VRNVAAAAAAAVDGAADTDVAARAASASASRVPAGSPIDAPQADAVVPRPLSLPWHTRFNDAVSAYLPLLLMAGLALGTWWLVKNTPLFDTDRPTAPLRHEPDYTMSEFMVQRFAANGALRVQIEGDAMRHFPDDDTLEIDNPHIRVFGDGGRETVATAKRALSNHDGSDVQLNGAAHVVRAATAKDTAIDFRGEFLEYLQFSERVRSNLPVVVTQGSTELHADAMDYDNLARLLDLKGHVQAVFAPPPAAPASAPAGKGR